VASVGIDQGRDQAIVTVGIALGRYQAIGHKWCRPGNVSGGRSQLIALGSIKLNLTVYSLHRGAIR
jgi:hypothetical protein